MVQMLLKMASSILWTSQDCAFRTLAKLFGLDNLKPSRHC